MAELDDELMKRCQKGDMEAFNLIVRRHRVALVNFVAQFVGSNQDIAEDLAQETFVRMFKAAKRYRMGTAKFTTWMYHIASNLCKNELRDRGRRSRFFVDSVNSDDEDRFGTGADLIATAPAHASWQPEVQFEQKELQRTVQDAIAQLPERYRLPLVLRDLQALNYEEISVVLALPLGTTKSRINRARLMLKDKLKTVCYELFRR